MWLGRGHVFAVLFGKHRSADEAGEVGLKHQGDGQHGVEQAGAEDRHEDECQQQAGEAQDQIHDAHDDDIDPAAEIAGEEAEDDAAHHRDGDHHRADQQRIAGAIDEAREQVTANRVGAEDVAGVAAGLPDRGQEERGLVLLFGQMGGEERGEDGDQHQQHEDHEADDSAAVHREIVPELLQRRDAGGVLCGGGGDFGGHQLTRMRGLITA